MQEVLTCCLLIGLQRVEDEMPPLSLADLHGLREPIEVQPVRLGEAHECWLRPEARVGINRGRGWASEDKGNATNRRSGIQECQEASCLEYSYI
jgi:hypothetical protein